MTDEALEARRAYQRAWRKRNPEKEREIHARYWQKKAEQAAKEQPEEVKA